MKIDATAYTGFHLTFDADTGELTSASGFSFRRATRYAGSLGEVLRSPEAVAPDQAMYYTYYLQSAPESIQDILNRFELTVTPVLLPPCAIAGEYVKTYGHYHPVMPGTPYAYQELYTQLYGTLLLFLQKRDPACPPTPLDCVLVTMTPGTTVLIPPDYAHVLINPTAAPALMAGLYCPNFQPDYSEVKRQRGLAYYMLAGDSDIQIEPNLSYSHAPALQRLDDVSGTRFDSGFSKGTPLWTAFTQSPQDYAYLSQPEAACAFFERS